MNRTSIRNDKQPKPNRVGGMRYRMKRSFSSPYHALPFTPSAITDNISSASSMSNLKIRASILDKTTSSYAKRSVSILKTRNIPSATSPISSPTKQNTKFVQKNRPAKSTKEHEKYEASKMSFT